MSIEALIERHIEALEKNAAETRRNSDILERVIAGQQAALDKIEQPKPVTTRKKADTPAPAAEPETETVAETPAAEPEKKPEPVAATAAPEVTDEDIRTAAGTWLNGKSVEERTAVAQWMGTILTHFDVGGKLTGPESVLDADQRAQALFYIKRKAAGLPVDFNADYDFGAEPTQGSAASEDPLG